MYKTRKTRRARKSNIAIKMILLVMIITACVLTIGARWNGRDVEDITPVPVDTTAEPQTQVVVLPTQAPATTPAPVATAAPVAAAEPVSAPATVEEFPITVQNGNSKLGPYWVDPMKATLTVEPDHVGHIESLAPYSDNGWFVVSQHTVDAIDESQLSVVSIYGASLPNVGGANLRPEDQSKVGVELARALYSYVERIDGTAHTLKAEPYDREIHILVGFLKVGEADSEYWTVWENHTAGYYTLCYVQGQKPPVETPVWHPPVDPTPVDPTPTPPTDVDPEPIWEDPTVPTPTPVPTEQPWDPSFNWDLDPEPVWEEPTTPPTTPAPSQDWDSDFNFGDNTDPQPVWEDGNQDPAPVWEPVSTPTATPAPATQSDWDAGFNFSSESTPSTRTSTPAPTAAHSSDPAPVWDSADTGSSSNSDSADEGWDDGFNF